MSFALTFLAWGRLAWEGDVEIPKSYETAV